MAKGGMPGGFDVNALMKQAQKMQSEMLAAQETLKDEVVEASAGGGMVTAVVSGTRELVSLRIDPSVVDPKEIQMLQDLIVAAVNQGLVKAKSIEEDEMRRTAMGMGLPAGML